jgi:DNA (cytosine-5)-methyltransferase 1
MERMPMTFGSLFAGIGGFDLGLERAGMTCKWQVEIDDYASRVLAKHWPDVPRHGDVRTFPTAAQDWAVDVICGGFPCQDISVAGKGAGLAGARSGLWYEFARIIGELRPRYVIVENVAAILGRGIESVLGSLSALGYDAEWHVIPASAVGAPHRRERVWIIAYANDQGQPNVSLNDVSRHCVPKPAGFHAADANCARRKQQCRPQPVRKKQPAVERCGWWASEPDVGRVAHGVASRVDRLRCLGNAVVPQVVEVIGRAIIKAEAEAQVAN